MSIEVVDICGIRFVATMDEENRDKFIAEKHIIFEITGRRFLRL